MKTVKVGNTVFGEGKPKICIPIVSTTTDDILSQARFIKKSGLADLCEWRIDYFDRLLDENNKLDEDAVLTTVKALKDALDTVPLLVTFRSKEEGGNLELDNLLYENLILMAVQTGYVDMVDIELFRGENLVGRLIKSVHTYESLVIASNHDFEKTPSKEDIVSRLLDMDRLGADICKLAAMPLVQGDVLTLLNATFEAGQKSEKPIVTMSMGELGSFSRLSGEFFGSAMTFGSLNETSAPGQIDVIKLSGILGNIHDCIGNSRKLDNSIVGANEEE
ncbi:MAG: type I 3-dehydroquinate dehydratase [Lachnospiraceae bacterium]|nr:type I 3-dehydroquinate dehydratase [Lachnospiraceae bacterium]